MDTLLQINTILSDYGGLESNIPIGHCYWDLLTKYRAGILNTYECSYDEKPLNAAPPPPPQAQDAIKLAALRKLCRDAIRDYKGESNIPFTHEYWFNMNVIKSIERQPE